MSKKARERALKRRQQQRRRQYMIVGSVVGVLVLGLVALIVYNELRPISLPDDIADAYEGIPQDTTEQGFPRLGDPAAPIVVEDYSSFGCPACQDFADGALETLKDDVEAGFVQLIFVPITDIGDTTHATDGAYAALCAGEQGAFWEMHNVVFHWLGQNGVTENGVRQAGEEIGLDVDELTDCYDDRPFGDLLDTADASFSARGFTSTPSVTINGEPLQNAGEVNQRVDQLIAQLGG